MPDNVHQFKNINHEIQLTSSRALIALIIMFTLLAALVLHLAYLQIYKHHLYQTLSTKNFLTLNKITAPRGLIYDRNGIVLATNQPSFTLELSVDAPLLSKQRAQILADILNKLSTIITLPPDSLNNCLKQLRYSHTFSNITLKANLSKLELAHLVEQVHELPNVHITPQLQRYYPFANTLSHVLGYVGANTNDSNKYNDNNSTVGKVGIEKFFNEELSGQPGYQELEVNASGRSLRVLKQYNPIPGHNLYLTIDSNLQLIAAQALAGHSGAIVAIQPRTGQILALVSMPDYDPNNMVQGININNTSATPDNHPLYNRAISGLYPLASTIKPYLALAGLEQQIITPTTTIHDPGWFSLPNSTHVFRDMKAHGIVNLTTAITTSCDVYFYNLANNLGIEAMAAILHDFGFGAISGLEMSEEVKGVVATPSWKAANKNLPWYPGDTIISGIGQGYMQATPIQLAVAVATLANRGQKFAPTLILKQETTNHEITAPETLALNKVILSHPEYWEEVITAMQQVVDNPLGTARRFGPHPNYTVAAKTGTAQVHAKSNNTEREDQTSMPEQLRDHGLIIAFAPVTEPEIALAIIVEHDRLAAVPIAKKILDYFFTHHTKEASNENITLH